jgi:hypothetical protein
MWNISRKSFTKRLVNHNKTVVIKSLATAATGKDAGKKAVGVPQPPKDEVKKRVEEIREYKQKLTDLRRNLVEQGLPKQSASSLRQARIEEGKLKVGTGYTVEEKAERKRKGLEKHNAHIEKVQEEFAKRERARILKQTMRRAKGDAYREELLNKATLQLAADIEQTWNKPVKDDLKILVPVNAPYLGVLPKFHAEIASAFGDDPDKIKYMYGPPRPVPDEESQHFGYDPRIVDYTEEKKSANWWASHSENFKSYKKPRAPRGAQQQQSNNPVTDGGATNTPPTKQS